MQRYNCKFVTKNCNDFNPQLVANTGSDNVTLIKTIKLQQTSRNKSLLRSGNQYNMLNPFVGYLKIKKLIGL